MNKNVRTTGISAAILIILMTLAFVILLVLFPPGEFLTGEQLASGYSKALVWPVIPSFILVLANIPLMVSLYFYAEDKKKPFALTGLLFGAAYAVCSGITYFVQLTVVPQNVHMEQITALALLGMHVKGSLAFALDNLGYTFLSLSLLLFSTVFMLKGLQGYCKAAFVVYGITGLMGTAGYLTGNAFLESFVLISAFPYLIAVVLTLVLYIRIPAEMVSA